MYNKHIKVVYLDEKIVEIEDSAFFYCEDLETVYMPRGLIKLGNKVFAHCPNLKNIMLYDKKITEINGEFFCFEGCIKIESLKIP